jgi:signal peptidase II
MWKLLSTAAPLYLLDQLTKFLVLRNLERGESHTIIPGFFDLVHVTNTGAAFGSFKENNIFFVVLSIATMLLLLILFLRGFFRPRWSCVALALLFAGIAGNLTDRLMHGHVIDFLDFYIGTAHWPAFNVADSCICAAAGIFVIESLNEKRTKSGPPILHTN